MSIRTLNDICVGGSFGWGRVVRFVPRFVVVTMFIVALAACRSQPSESSDAPSRSDTDLEALTGTVSVDGSSTVFPLTEAVASSFEQRFTQVRVSIAISGTGGGFKRFVTGETDFSNASRPIKWVELLQCREHGVKFVELPIAYDGLTIVVHPSNSWVKQLTVEQLRLIYLEGGAKRWNEIEPDWPDQPIKIFSPGTDSGTYDYFKEVVAGEAPGSAIRSDLSASEDDNVLVTGVAGEPNAIGFFGAAYYFENQQKLRAVPIVHPQTKEPVMPTPETIRSGHYVPFSRPLLVYANAASLRRPEVRKFAGFLLEHAAEAAKRVGYVPLPEALYERARDRLRSRTTGTHFWTQDGQPRRGTLEMLYEQAETTE